MTSRNVTGVTLVELLAVIAIAAILMAIGVPSYKYVTTTDRVASEVNGLVGDLEFAREEAIKEGGNVNVCPSSDGVNCLATTAWDSGWVVCSDPSDTGSCATGQADWRVQRPFNASGSADTFTMSNSSVNVVTFNRLGFVSTNLGTSGVMLSLHDSTDSSAYTHCLAISTIGQLAALSDGQSSPTGQTCS